MDGIPIILLNEERDYQKEKKYNYELHQILMRNVVHNIWYRITKKCRVLWMTHPKNIIWRNVPRENESEGSSPLWLIFFSIFFFFWYSATQSSMKLVKSQACLQLIQYRSVCVFASEVAIILLLLSPLFTLSCIDNKSYSFVLSVCLAARQSELRSPLVNEKENKKFY